MATSNSRRHLFAKQYHDHVNAWLESGLSQSAFCQMHQLPLSTFNKWVSSIQGPSKLSLSKLSKEKLAQQQEQLTQQFSKLFVGISIRESGQTVTLTDRTKWDSSMSELVSLLTNSRELTPLISLARGAVHIGNLNEITTLRTEVDHLRNALKQVHHLSYALEQVHQSTSWRITKPMRFIVSLIRREISLKEGIGRLRKQLL